MTGPATDADDPTTAPPADAAPTSPDGPWDGEDSAPQLDWWHRDHPVFAALTGFFTGLVFVIVVPGAYAGILASMMDAESAEDLFPFVLVSLAIPIGLLVHPTTRRFGRYMLLGIVSTAVVVGGVAALVLWTLVSGG